VGPGRHDRPEILGQPVEEDETITELRT
jgi:hypothetical protein